MRRNMFGRGLLVLLCVLGAGAVTPALAGPPWDLNNNGLPDVCQSSVSNPTYTFQFVGVQPAPTAGEFDWVYRLIAKDSASRKKISRVVMTFNRGVVPGQILGASTQGSGTGIQKGGFGAGDTSTKVAFGDFNAFTAAITVQPGNSLDIPFSIRSTVSRVGLISVGVDTGSGGFFGCQSFVEDTVAGPKSIEGPAVAETTVDPNSVVAASTIYSSQSNVCPVEVVRNGAGGISFVQYTAEALANGCNPAFILSVPQTELFIEFNGFKLPIHTTADGFEGNAPVLLGSTDKCLRIYDRNTGSYILVSTITTRNGCTS